MRNSPHFSKHKLPLFRLIFIVLIVIGPADDLLADNYIGFGFSGVTMGRNIPALHVANFSDTYRVSFISTGVKTPVYFHNAYQLAYLSTWQPGEFMWGEVEAGFGASILHAVRGYREDPDDAYEKESNTVFGPAIYLGWEIAPSVMLSLEVIYGLYNTYPAYLIFQENAAGSIGVKF